MSIQRLGATMVAPYKAIAASVKVSLLARARRFYFGNDFGAPSVDMGASVNEALAAINAEHSPSGAYRMRGGKLRVERGTWPAKEAININRAASGQSSVTLMGDGQSTTSLDFTGAPALTDGIACNDTGAAYGVICDIELANAPRRGVSFVRASRKTLRNVQAYKSGGDGFYFGNPFVSIVEKCTSVENGGNGFNFDNRHPDSDSAPTQFQKTSQDVTACYAYNNAGSGFVLGNMYYSVLNACASDNNGIYGYLIGGKASGLTMNGCGSETTGRSGIAVVTTDAKDDVKGVTINNAFAYNNNQANSGYPNLLYVQSANGGKSRVRLENSVSEPRVGETVPDVIVDGSGAVLELSGNNYLPKGWLARNGGYIDYDPITYVIDRNIPASTATAVCNLKNTQGYNSRYAGVVTVVASNQHPSVEGRYLSIYQLMVYSSSGNRYANVISQVKQIGSTTAQLPNFTWSVNANNQLVATPDTGVGGHDFWFEIDTDSQVVAYAY